MHIPRRLADFRNVRVFKGCLPHWHIITRCLSLKNPIDSADFACPHQAAQRIRFRHIFSGVRRTSATPIYRKISTEFLHRPTGIQAPCSKDVPCRHVPPPDRNKTGQPRKITLRNPRPFSNADASRSIRELCRRAQAACKSALSTNRRARAFP